MTTTDGPSTPALAAPAFGSRRGRRVADRAEDLLGALEAWSARGAVRSLMVKGLVTVLGPVVMLVGLAMTVLPGPGLVVMALGMGLLALEYPWARHLLGVIGRALSAVKAAALPEGGSRLRRGAGLVGVGAFFVGTFALTTAITAYLGTLTFL